MAWFPIIPGNVGRGGKGVKPLIMNTYEQRL